MTGLLLLFFCMVIWLIALNGYLGSLGAVANIGVSDIFGCERDRRGYGIGFFELAR